ncbi:MAG: hypothetical protein JW729_05545 [Bacteroidales bacterium]|nr:hypothetical protein [Bacteroidales bacterium]
MIDFAALPREIPEYFEIPAMILLAGGGQNVGKTSFASALIKHLKNKDNLIYGLKITPHFHQPNPKNIILQTDSFQVTLEKDLHGKKDSSRMLKAGADEVFFVQTKTDQALPEIMSFLSSMATEKVIWVCESGGLRAVVKPGLFLFFMQANQDITKESAQKWIPLADKLIEFDGVDFDFSVQTIQKTDSGFEIR